MTAILIIAAAFCALPSAEGETDIGVGDFWEYSLSMDDEGMVMDGTFKLKVDSQTTVGSQQVFILKITGTGEVSGDLEGDTISGSFDMSGHQTRAVADFNIMDEVIEMDMTMEAMGMSVTGTLGFSTEYDPSVDDYIGDDDLSLNSVVSSTAEATESSWFNILGMNESEDDTSTLTTKMTVVETNVSVTVPAGTFDCCKIKVESTIDDFIDSTEYWYYSDEVGYYVKMDASSFGGTGDMELESYNSGDDGGILGMFTGDNLWVTILIIAIVVVLIIVIVGTRSRRGKTPTTMGQAAQPGPEIPPPYPGQPPGPPGDPGMPPPPGYPPVG